MIDLLLQCLYSVSCKNQSQTYVAAHDIQKFQTKLQSIEALALISAPRISILVQTFANDNSLSLGYISK